MRALRDSGLEAVTIDAATDGRPFLGICVGMQMLFDGSDESPEAKGLGVVSGRITRLPNTVRLPQMGWNTLEARAGARLLAGLPDPAWCYFVHTFAPGAERRGRGRGVVRVRPALRRRGGARTVVGHAVPPGEERRGRHGDARQLREGGGGVTMDLYPSIDLLGGQVVRLLRGDYDAETVYDDDAGAVARRFAARARAGSTWSISTPPATAATRTSA